MTNARQKYVSRLKRNDVAFRAVDVVVGVEEREESEEDLRTNLALGEETGSRARLSW